MKRVNTLQDRRNFGDKLVSYGLLSVVFVLVMTFVGSVNRAKLVNREIMAKKEELAKIQKENQEYEKKIAVAQSQEYIEKEIRNKLGLVKNGEIVVVLPDKETLLKVVQNFDDDQTEYLPDPNWKKWMKLFL